MTAGQAIQEAAVAALASIDGLAVFDGPPARASYPYVSIDAASETDWSHKSGTGREVPIAITVWDDVPERLSRLSGEIEQAVNAINDLTAGLNGWQLVSLRFVRRRIVRDVAGPWAAAIDFRARLLLLQGE